MSTSTTSDAIRSATLADVDSLLALCRAFHAESVHAARPFDEPHVRRSLEHVIRHAPHRCIFVAPRGAELVGMLVGTLGTYPFSPQRLAHDTVFYVAPRHRNGVAARGLLRAFEAWAGEHGALELVLGVSSGIRPERTHALLVRLGFEPGGSIFRRTLVPA